MEVYIDDIPEEGLTIRASADKDGWLKDIVKEVVADDYAAGDSASVVVTFIKCEDNIDIRGDITIKSHPTCDRCLTVYAEKKKIPFHVTMAPLYESAHQREKNEEMEKELVREDLEFSYYEGDRIDLSELVREQMVLEKPLKHLCRDDCAGICQHCGRNLNEGPCGCVEEHRDHRWDVLKDFKPKTARRQKSGIGSQKSGVGSQKSEARSQKK